MLVDLTGKGFGRWLVLTRAENVKNQTTWLCVCECGTFSTVCAQHLKNKKSTRCKICTGIDFRGVKKPIKHGKSNSGEYKSWVSMKSRCYSKNHIHYMSYGGRGITVCDEWKCSFERFYEDMGARPVGTSLDRIDNNGPYVTNNCRWATLKEQANNKRSKTLIVYGGTKYRIQELADKLSLNKKTLYSQVSRGSLVGAEFVRT